MKSKLYALRIFMSAVLLAHLSLAKAQCPGTVTASIASQTNATCPSNGAVTIGSNANAVPSATYQALIAPSGVSLAVQSSNVFTSLPAGNYTFKVTCGASSATVATTITTSYTQLTGATTITNLCTSYLAGATITASAAGGTTPYTYALRKTVDPNYNDGLSTYGGSNIFNPTDTGVYQVRIKDNCGNFITKTVNISQNVPKIILVPDWFEFYAACGSTNGILYFYLTDKNDLALSMTDLAFGLRVDVYEKGAGCTRGNFIKTVNFTQFDNEEIIVPNNKNLYLKVTNSCGDTSFTCYDITPPPAFVIFSRSIQTGCPNATYPNGLLDIVTHWYKNTGPGYVYFSLETQGGLVVRTPTKDSIGFHSLPYGTYVLKATNGCGAIASTTVSPQALGAPANFASWYDGFTLCTDQTGTLTYHAFVDGYIKDLVHATITITAGPSNVGVVGIYYPNSADVQWRNMLPGNYTASVITGCDSKSINFTVSATEPVLVQNLNVSTQQICGNGNTINAVMNYNGNGTVSYELYNASNALLATNTSGIFININAGSYTVKVRIQQSSLECSGTSYTIDKPVTILPLGAAPQVVKKIVMVCEDIAGNPTANGKAIISMNGFGPFKVEVKRVTDPDASYVVKFAATSTNFTIDNLVAYQDYRIRITDQCGSTAQTDVSVGILQQFAQSSAVGPCLGQAYTISAPDMIDATYAWTKGGVNVGNTKDLVFANWNATNNGTYVCTIVIGGGCVTRTYSTQVNSFYCGVLPIKLESFTANANNCKTMLAWNITNQNDLSQLKIEKSVDGVNFSSLYNFEKTSSAQVWPYQYVDAYPIKGNNYYRLVLVDKDGVKTNSPVMLAKNNCNGEIENDLLAFPNPMHNNILNVFVANTNAGNVNIKLINQLGQVVLAQKVKTTQNNTTVSLDVKSLTHGTYTLAVTNANGRTLQQKLLKL